MLEQENFKSDCIDSENKSIQNDIIPTREEYVLLAIQFQIHQFFKAEGVSYKSSWDYKKTIYNYLDWLQKLIIPVSRNVEYSDVLKEKMEQNFDEETVELIKTFADDFISGKNMNCHLSTNISESATKDYLRNVWHICHLHLNKKNADTMKDMKKNRSDLLLLCSVLDDKVYFIDVVSHPSGKDFLNIEFLKIVQQNGWMQKIGFQEITDYKSGSMTPIIEESDKIFQAYTSGMNTNFDLNGKGYWCLNVIATSKDSFQCNRKYTKIVSAIRDILANGNFVDFQLYPPFDEIFGTIIIRNWSGQYMEYAVFK